MHLSKSLVALTVSPIIHTSAFRSAPILLQYPACSSDPSLSGTAELPPRTPIKTQSSRGFTSSTTPTSFRYRIGASFSAKGKWFNPKKDLYSFESPKPDPERDEQEGEPPTLQYSTGRGASGQDAFFVSKLGNTQNVAFGVADGVGGWVDSGIDPAHFSHGLCQNMVDVAKSATESEIQDLHATTLLKEGYARVVADDSVEGGGSTACIAVGRDNGTLEVAK